MVIDDSPRRIVRPLLVPTPDPELASRGRTERLRALDRREGSQRRLVLRDEELARVAAAECGTMTAELMADYRRRIAVNTRDHTRRSSRRAALARAVPVDAARVPGGVAPGQAETTLRWAGYARGDDGSWSLPEPA